MRSSKLTALVTLLLAAPVALAADTWTIRSLLTDGVSSTNVVAHSTSGAGGKIVNGPYVNGEPFTANTYVPGSEWALLCDYDKAGQGAYGIVNNLEGTSCGTSAPQHAADNNSGATDMFLLSFTNAVKLSSLTIGWNGTDNYGADSDLTVLRYKGATAPTITGLTAAGLLSNQWEKVANLANVGSEPGNTATFNSTGASSSWWLISAWNSAFGSTISNCTYSGTACTNGYTLGGTNDYFKLVSVAGYTVPPPGVPEPGSLALLGVGLLGLLRASRKNKQ